MASSTLHVRLLATGASLVEFMYKGTIKRSLSDEERSELMEVADMLQFDDLRLYLE